MNLLPKIFKNREVIFEAILNKIRINFGHLSEDEQSEITRRYLICTSCPFMSENAKADLSQNYKSDRPDPHCSFCQCNIDLKTSSLQSNCGIEAYNQTSDGQKTPLDLKWTKYEKTN